MPIEHTDNFWTLDEWFRPKHGANIDQWDFEYFKRCGNVFRTKIEATEAARKIKKLLRGLR